MRPGDTVMLMSHNLRVRLGRALLTANGVLIGTAAVVILVSLGVGMQRGVMGQFETIGDLRAIQVQPAISQNVQNNGMESPRETKFVRRLNQAAVEELRALPGVVTVLPQVRPEGLVECTFDKWTSMANVVGLEVHDLAELGYSAQAGTTRLRRGTVVLSQGALASFGEVIEVSGGGRIRYIDLDVEELLGKKLRFVIHKTGGQSTRTVELRVAGVLVGGSMDRSILLPADDVTTWNTYAFGRPSRDFSQAVVEVASTSEVEPLAEQIEALGFAASTQETLIERVEQTYLLISVLLGITGMTSLLMAGVGVANTMMAATLEQTLEIGLWKALGASNREVMGLISGQAAVIGLLGGMGGALVGWLGVRLFNLLGGLNVTVQVWGQTVSQVMLAETPPWLLLAAPVFALVVGLISGLAPAMRAAALPPIEALKEE